MPSLTSHFHLELGTCNLELVTWNLELGTGKVLDLPFEIFLFTGSTVNYRDY